MSSYNDSEDLIGTSFAVAGLTAILAAFWNGSRYYDGQLNKAESEKSYEKGIQLYKSGDYSQALGYFLNSIDRDAAQFRSYNQIAIILADIKQELLFAEKFAEKAIENAENYYNKSICKDTLGEVLRLSGKIDQAIKQFNECLRMNPSIDLYLPENNTNYRLALCYVEKEEWENAQTAIENSLRIKPKNPKMYATAGYICLMLGVNATSVSYYQNAINLINASILSDDEKKEQSSLWLCNAGVAYARLGDQDNSNKMIEEAYKKNPQNPYAIINLAAVYIQGNDKRKMFEYLELGIPLLGEKDKTLIDFLLTNSCFENNREGVLDLLKIHKKIDRTDYLERKNAILENKLQNQNTVTYHISGDVGVISSGQKANITDVLKNKGDSNE